MVFTVFTVCDCELMCICIAAGAHELPKAAKEHATRFHDNPNYFIHFQKFSGFF